MFLRVLCCELFASGFSMILRDIVCRRPSELNYQCHQYLRFVDCS